MITDDERDKENKFPTFAHFYFSTNFNAKYCKFIYGTFKNR